MRRGVGKPFVKGRSGNPGGRPKLPAELRERAQVYSIEALDVLHALATDKGQVGSVRVSAASAIIDRGYGKPAVMLHAAINRDMGQMSDAELLAVIMAGDDGSEGPGRLN